MTRQVMEGSPITVTARSQVGGFIPDTSLTIDGQVFKDPMLTEQFDEHRANGAGEFVFYAAPGSVINVTVDDPLGVPQEPIQVVGVVSRPGGAAVVQPDETPAVHETSPVSEQVTDGSLVGAVAPADRLPEDQGGALAVVGAQAGVNVPPAPDNTPSPQTPQEAIDAQVAPQDAPAEPTAQPAVEPATPAVPEPAPVEPTPAVEDHALGSTQGDATV